MLWDTPGAGTAAGWRDGPRRHGSGVDDRGRRKHAPHRKNGARRLPRNRWRTPSMWRVTGLKPQRPYWYQFKAGQRGKPDGPRHYSTEDPATRCRNSSLPSPPASTGEAGLWTAYEHMLADDPSLVIHLGRLHLRRPARENGVRKHNSAEIVSLSDYRNRHALYKTDPPSRRCIRIARGS